MFIKSVPGFLILTFFIAAVAIAEGTPTTAYTEPITGMEFAAIPGGTFEIGKNSTPKQKATVEPFLLGRYEVTFEQYSNFCFSTGRILPNDKGWGMGNRPVINVTWHDAVAFTNWLSEKSGKRFRLPSEVEWEHAARGGANTPYPWEETATPPHANCRNCGSEWDGKKTAPVGSFAPNGYGLYDVIGNVYEWCLDGVPVRAEDQFGESILKDNPSDELPMRAQRSGSYLEPLNALTLSHRYKDRPDAVEPEYGFRVLLEP